jgi:Fe2+ transport system protein FeoA
MTSFFVPTSLIDALREGLAAAVVLAGIALAYPAKIGRTGKHASRKHASGKDDLQKDDLRKDHPCAGNICGDNLCGHGLRHPGNSDGADFDAGGEQAQLPASQPAVALTELEPGEAGTIDHISLPFLGQQFLMRVGFVPGVQVEFSRRAPLGDPSVYLVDGTEIALRSETAKSIMVRRAEIPQLGDLP